MSSRKKVCVVHQQDGSDSRVSKVCRSASRRFDVTYLGWDRDLTNVTPDMGSTARRLFRMRSGYGPRAVTVRIAFVLWTLVELVRLRPSTVVAVNEELAVAYVFLRPFLRFKLILDIHDPFADRLASARLRRAVRSVQRFARDRADAIWVTDEDRYSRLDDVHKAKSSIVPNYPNRPSFDLAEVAARQTGPEVVVAVVGSLHASRGLGTLRAAMDACGGCRAEVAGWVADDEARAFCESRDATYHGVVGTEASLRLMGSCDVIFCFYDPRIPNNVNASPNKVYEAVCLGKKCIINSETRVARWVAEQGFGYTCGYDDAAALAAILRDVRARLPEHRVPNESLVRFAESRLYWEVAEPELLGTL